MRLLNLIPFEDDHDNENDGKNKRRKRKRKGLKPKETPLERAVRLRNNHRGLRLTYEEACEYRDKAADLYKNGRQDTGAFRALREEFQAAYSLTELEAVNILNGYNIEDYVRKYYSIMHLIISDKDKNEKITNNQRKEIKTMNRNNEKTPNLVIPDADRRLREICEKGLTKRFGDNPPAAVKDRLELECKCQAKFNIYQQLGKEINRGYKRYVSKRDSVVTMKLKEKHRLTDTAFLICNCDNLTHDLCPP